MDSSPWGFFCQSLLSQQQNWNEDIVVLMLITWFSVKNQSAFLCYARKIQLPPTKLGQEHIQKSQTFWVRKEQWIFFILEGMESRTDGLVPVPGLSASILDKYVERISYPGWNENVKKWQWSCWPGRPHKDGPGKGNVSIATLRKSNTQYRWFLLTNIHNMNLEEKSK